MIEIEIEQGIKKMKKVFKLLFVVVIFLVLLAAIIKISHKQ